MHLTKSPCPPHRFEMHFSEEGRGRPHLLELQRSKRAFVEVERWSSRSPHPESSQPRLPRPKAEPQLHSACNLLADSKPFLFSADDSRSDDSDDSDDSRSADSKPFSFAADDSRSNSGLGPNPAKPHTLRDLLNRLAGGESRKRSA